MDLEEAKLKSKITPAERASVEKYINSSHAVMKSLIGFNVRDYLKSFNKGWFLPGINPDKTKEEAGEEVLVALENAADVYSAMVKNMYDEPAPYKLMRGTSNDEARNLHAGSKYNRILSTTTNETTAKSFGRYGNAAFLRIVPGANIPFINVDTFVGRENLDRYESEYILAPFTKVKSCTFRSDWDGYKYYDVELEKPEMREFEEGEKQELQKQIRENFADIIEKGKELESLEDKYRWLLSRRGEDAEDRAYLAKERNSVWEQIQNISPEVTAFEEVMNRYAQGLFAEREKEFKLAYDITRKEEERIWREEAKRRQAETIKEKSKEFGNLKNKFNMTMDKAPDTYTNQYYALKDEEIKYYHMAKVLQIPFNMRVENDRIEPNISQISQNIEAMKQRVETLQEGSSGDERSAISATDKMQAFGKVAANVRVNENLLMESVRDYSQEAMFETKKELDKKIQDTIKSTKLRLLDRQRQELQNRKISWLGRIRGLGKLRDIELANIALEEQILRNSSVKAKGEYSVQDSLADMRAFSIRELGGQNTEEMENIINNVKSVFEVHEDVIEDKARRKLNAVPMVIVDRRKRVRTSEKIAKAEKRNEGLRVEFADTYNSYDFNEAYRQSGKPQSLERFYNLMEETANITRVENDENERGIKQIRAGKEQRDNNDFEVK